MAVTHSTVTRVVHHPLASHNLGIIRNKNSSAEQFRLAMKRLGTMVLLESTQTLPTVEVRIETPLTVTTCQILAPEKPVLIVPILRAGLILSELAIDLIPSGKVYHIGVYRNPETLEPVSYYNKLPDTLPYSQSVALVLDPMLATAGSALSVFNILKDQGIPEANIHFSCVIASPEGIEALHKQYPAISVTTAAIDERLNEKGYIIPGLGDAGDRAFDSK
jgi:uracil phosphoribosyltransferase